MKVPKWPCDIRIYRLYWDDYEDVGYVGHTRHLLLSRRMPGHRTQAKIGTKAIIYQKIRERGGFEYELLETIFCENFDTARTHEKRWKRQLKANLNTLSPITTKDEAMAMKKEYYQKNKDEICKKMKIHRDENKVEISKKRKKTYILNKENILEKSAKYNATPKAKIIRKKYNQKYYNENKEKILTKNKEWKDKNKDYYKKYYEAGKIQKLI